MFVKWETSISDIKLQHQENVKGDDIITLGSVEASVYKGRNLLKGGFNDHTKAIQYAWSMIKSSKLQHIVSKKVITKYNLVS